MTFKGSFFCLILIVFCPCFGQDKTSKIDKKDLRMFIKTFSSVQFDGRAIDNNGQLRTQQYIIDRFKTLQIEPFSPDGYLDKFMLNRIDRGEIYLQTQNQRILRNMGRMIFEGNIQHNNEIEREIVFGGSGTEEELNQIDVENRFVLILPVSFGDEMAIKKRLEVRNACGLIMYMKDENKFETAKNRLNEFHLQKRFSIPNPPDTNHINLSAVEPTVSFPIVNTIKIPGAEVKNVINFTQNKLLNPFYQRKIKHTPPTKIRINFEGVASTIETANVIGVIRGESEQAIIISAHYDHIGKGENVYYPGADDNASGVAALLELAEEFVQYEKLKYTMIFLATTAEEGGLLGSQHYVEKPDFDPEKTLCNINMDMISRCDPQHTNHCDYLYCIGIKNNEPLDSLIRKANMLYPHCAFDYSANSSDIFFRTDGYNFKKKGVPSILFFSGFHDDYHKPTDTIDKIDFDLLEHRIKLICEVIKLLQEIN